jgi:predicted nuclease with TOPRIM domain
MQTDQFVKERERLKSDLERTQQQLQEIESKSADEHNFLKAKFTKLCDEMTLAIQSRDTAISAFKALESFCISQNLDIGAFTPEEVSCILNG